MKHTLSLSILALLAFNGCKFSTSSGALALVGILDGDFSGDGIVAQDFGFDTVVNDLLIQPDGKILTIGATATEMAVARFNTDGSPDTTFDTDGIAVTAFPVTASAVRGALQSDGKIVVVGPTSSFLGMARFNTNGTLDTTFNVTGMVQFGPITMEANALAVLSSGQIMVAGRAMPAASFDHLLARYNADGTIDATFGVGGFLTQSITAGDDNIRDIAIQANGRIVAAGSSFNGLDNDITVVRYTTAGALDTTFNTTGIVITADAVNEDLSRVRIQSTGQIVAAGFTNRTNQDFLALRLNSDGTADTGFSTAGRFILDLTGDDRIEAMLIDASGTFFFAGPSNTAVQAKFSVVKASSVGVIDLTYGTSGTVTTAIGTISDIATGVALQSDGAVVMAGTTTTATGTNTAVIRLK